MNYDLVPSMLSALSHPLYVLHQQSISLGDKTHITDQYRSISAHNDVLPTAVFSLPKLMLPSLSSVLCHLLQVPHQPPRPRFSSPSRSSSALNLALSQAASNAYANAHLAAGTHQCLGAAPLMDPAQSQGLRPAEDPCRSVCRRKRRNERMNEREFFHFFFLFFVFFCLFFRHLLSFV